MTVGVITHILNPSRSDVQLLAREVERAGGDWLGVPDAFWWRDCWLLLAAASEVTERISLGPVATNPYLRHPFHTVSAVATLQEIAGPRVFVGLAAGGSEVTGVAGQSRQDAPKRVAEVAQLLRSVAAGAPLDGASGRAFEPPLSRPPVLVAGRGRGMLTTAGQEADQALLWAIPTSDLERSIGVVREAGAARSIPPALTWAPLVVRDAVSRERIETIAAYSVLNSSRALRQSWGLEPADIDLIREDLLRGGAAAATERIPQAAIDDLVLPDPDPGYAAQLARRLGITGIAVPAFAVDGVSDQIAWAHEVLRQAKA